MFNDENANNAGQQVIWQGSIEPNTVVKSLEHKNVVFYKRCFYGPLKLVIGDYILVSNADAAEPDTVDGCDVAKILHLYELREMTDKEPCRALVQWFSRPKSIPHKSFDSDDIAINFDLEVIEEHRPYDNDVALGSIFRKCIVLEGKSTENAEDIIKANKDKKSTGCPMFVSRYKFLRVKKTYRLIPLEIQLDELPRSKRKSQAAADDGTGSTHKSSSRKRASVAAPAAATPEFVDVAYYNSENKVSPIKIVGGRSVVRLSEKKKSALKADGVQSEINANYLPASPLTEKNPKVSTPKSRASAARRNLNLSLDKGANTTADSDCLNYSIVHQTPDPKTPSTEMKIKLRISERRRSVRLQSMDDERDPLELLDREKKESKDSPSKQPLKRLGVTNGDIYHTPTKKSKELAAETVTPTTNRRKSILKSATSRLGMFTFPLSRVCLSNSYTLQLKEPPDAAYSCPTLWSSASLRTMRSYQRLSAHAPSWRMMRNTRQRRRKPIRAQRVHDA